MPFPCFFRFSQVEEKYLCPNEKPGIKYLTNDKRFNFKMFFKKSVEKILKSNPASFKKKMSNQNIFYVIAIWPSKTAAL